MSLIEDVRMHYRHESYPPDGGDLDYDNVDGKWVEKDTTTERISYEVVDDSPRWGNLIQAVYQRGDEYVAVQDVEPATEMQHWGDYGDPSIFEVRPVEVTVTKYEKV